MTHSKLTDQVRRSNQSESRRGTTVDTFLIHHQAGTNDNAVIDAMVTGSKQVSSNYTISNEGRITSVVDESQRAWTSGSTTDNGRGKAWDMRAITVEIENETAAPHWNISDAANAAAAALLNDLRKRYTIRHVLGHRHLWEQYRASYPTYCPGPNAVANILAIADKTVDIKPAKVKVVKAVAKKLYTSSAVDGIRGPIYWTMVQTAGRKAGLYSYKYKIDGVPGPKSEKVEVQLLARWLNKQ